MIDYEKLKFAHKICAETDDFHFDWHLGIEKSLFNSENTLQLYRLNNDLHDELVGIYNSFDDLIEKIQSLVKPEPKYKVGSILFFRDDTDIHEIRIDEIINDGEIWYLYRNSDGGYSDTVSSFDQFNESDLFPTRQSLIEHQIEMWQKMSCDNGVHNFNNDEEFNCIYCGIHELDTQTTQPQVDVDRCEHEFYAYYRNPEEATVVSRKCIKCGEFYR